MAAFVQPCLAERIYVSKQQQSGHLQEAKKRTPRLDLRT